MNKQQTFRSISSTLSISISTLRKPREKFSSPSHIMGLFDFLKSKSRMKPYDLIRSLAQDLRSAQAASPESFTFLSVPDSDYNELENYLAAACAGVTANVHIKKHPKADDIERCLVAAVQELLLVHIAAKISDLSPETRRILSAIWGYLLKLEHPKSFQRPMVEFLVSHLGSVDRLLESYGKSQRGADVTIGIMIRDASRFSKIVEHILKDDLVYMLFPVMASGNFDVSSDAFQTMREVLTNHKDVSAPWLSKNFDKFFSRYMGPLQSPTEDSYVIVRQSLSVLSGILLDRQFMDTMLQFVNREDFLKSILVLMSNESKAVKYEAFHVFKIFAANPQKPPKVAKILSLNYNRILRLLDQIENDRLDDNEFRQDKKAVVGKLEMLSKTVK